MKNKVLTYSISASLLIVALSVAYYFVFYMPKQNELKLKREEEKEEQQRISEATKKDRKDTDYSLCTSTASSDYSTWWNDACKSQGLKDDCRLPSKEAESFNQAYDKEKDRCLQLYKSN